MDFSVIQDGWRKVAADREAAIDRYYTSFPDLKARYKEINPRFEIKMQSKTKNMEFVIAQVEVPWGSEIRDAVKKATSEAKDKVANPNTPKIPDPQFVLYATTSNYRFVVGVAPALNGNWGRPSKQGYTSPLLRLNEMLFGGFEDPWNVWLTDVCDMNPPDEPTHRGVTPKTTKLTVYRGVAIGPKDDPTAGKLFRGDGASDRMGSSWSSDMNIAKAIAERALAGFNLNNTPGDPMRIKPGTGPNNRSYEHEVPSYVPTLLRAEVVLGENGQLYEGIGGYRYVNAEQEINIPPGMEFTLTGWMQADEISDDPKAHDRAWEIYDEDMKARKLPKDEQNAYYEKRYSDEVDKASTYEVVWRWPSSWHSVNLKKKAS